MELYIHSATEPYRDILKLQFLITSGYYIEPSLSTALVYVHSGTRPLLWYAYRLIFLSAQWNAFLFLSGPVQSLEIWGEQVKVILRRFVCIRNKKGQTFVGILVFLILFFLIWIGIWKKRTPTNAWWSFLFCQGFNYNFGMVWVGNGPCNLRLRRPWHILANKWVGCECNAVSAMDQNLKRFFLFFPYIYRTYWYCNLFTAERII